MLKQALDFTMETEKRVTPSVADELAKKLIQDKIKQEAMLKVECASPPPEVVPTPALPPQPPQGLPPSKEKKPRSRKKDAKEPSKSSRWRSDMDMLVIIFI